MRRGWAVLCDVLLLVLLAALAGCSSSPTKPPAIYSLKLHWTEPAELDNGEQLAADDLTGYRLTCRDSRGTIIAVPSLTRYVQAASIMVRPGTYSCEIEAQARGVWSSPSNIVTKAIP